MGEGGGGDSQDDLLFDEDVRDMLVERGYRREARSRPARLHACKHAVNSQPYAHACAQSNPSPDSRPGPGCLPRLLQRARSDESACLLPAACVRACVRACVLTCDCAREGRDGSGLGMLWLAASP